METTSNSGWTFLSNYAHVIICLHRYPDSTLREVSLKVGITERAVQKIVADLERDGFIEKEKIGRKNHYKIFHNKLLRHPLEDKKSIGDLITLLNE
jgi:predicted transcriptional regulator